MMTPLVLSGNPPSRRCRRPRPGLLLASLALVFAPRIDAAAPADEVFAKSMAFVEAHWDDRVAMIWSPNAVARTRVHRVRESTWYGLGLLRRDAPGDRARAARIFEAVLEQQINEPGHAWDGTFHRFPEEPHVPQYPKIWDDYDPNWRQFIGTTFAVALIRFEDRLPADLRARLLRSIGRALDGERRHQRLDASYTNIALMQAFLLGFAGPRLNRPELSEEGARLAEEVAAAFKANGTFEEYNSPTYYGVDFYGLALWRAFGATERMRTLGAEIEAALWRDTAAFYHAGLRNLCGPYDRSYGMDMTRYVSLTGLWLRRVLPADLAPHPDLDHPSDHVHDFVYAPVFDVVGTEIPEDAMQHFRRFGGERTVERRLPRGRIATAWLADSVMFGGEYTALGRGAGGPWNSLHPATIHWKQPSGAIGWVLLSQSPRVDAVATPGRLAVRAIGDSTFTVSAEGLSPQLVSRDRWDLPGLVLNVETDATGFDVQTRDGRLLVTYREATHIRFLRP